MRDGTSIERTRRRLLRRIAIGAVAGVALSAPSALAANSITSPSSTSYLNAVACASANDCWAVGSYKNTAGGYLNQAQHWTGGKWKLAKTPQPGTSSSDQQDQLYGVACPSRSTCWAVGDSYAGTGHPQLNEIFRWNGKKWSAVKPPQPGGKSTGAINNLTSVACNSTRDCSAVGVFTGGSGGFLNQTLHWNGKKWSKVNAPSPGGAGSGAFNILQGLACPSSSDCWAVGDFQTTAYFNQALRWNGKKWTPVKAPQPGHAEGQDLTAVSCSSAHDCVAVGDLSSGVGAELNQALTWGGQRWRAVKVPSPGGFALNDQNQLNGVSCVSQKRCWAVGSFSTSLGPNHDQALRFNGKKWVHVTTPQPGGTGVGDNNQLKGVTCLSASNCWAVGQYGNSSESLDLILHWNGHKWARK